MPYTCNSRTHIRGTYKVKYICQFLCFSGSSRVATPLDFPFPSGHHFYWSFLPFARFYQMQFTDPWHRALAPRLPSSCFWPALPSVFPQPIPMIFGTSLPDFSVPLAKEQLFFRLLFAYGTFPHAFIANFCYCQRFAWVSRVVVKIFLLADRRVAKEECYEGLRAWPRPYM